MGHPLPLPRGACRPLAPGLGPAAPGGRGTPDWGFGAGWVSTGSPTRLRIKPHADERGQDAFFRAGLSKGVTGKTGDG